MALTPAEMLHRFFQEGVSKQNVDLLTDLITDDYQNHDLPAPVPGPEGMRMVMGMFFAGFPDIKVTTHDTLTDGDRVASRGEWTGTHQGEFMGVPATGRTVTVSFIDIWRVEDGKFAENWVQMDILGLMQQLGVVPTPEQAPA